MSIFWMVKRLSDSLCFKEGAKRAHLLFMHSSQALPQAEAVCIKRRCAQSGASSALMPFSFRNSGSIREERLVSVDAKSSYAVAGWIAAVCRVSSRPMVSRGNSSPCERRGLYQKLPGIWGRLRLPPVRNALYVNEIDFCSSSTLTSKALKTVLLIKGF